MKKEVLEKIKKFDKDSSGEVVEYVITAVVQGDGIALYLFEADGIYSAAIAYDGGEVFFLRDWQGARPEALEEVAEFDWVCENGQDAIVFDGFPRTFFG